MCGILGIHNLTGDSLIHEHQIRQMLAMLRHRGPDQFGIYLNDGIGLGSSRLSIIDLGGGQQPISNEDQSLWIVFNGEIFNYIELRPELEKRGHHLSTNSDTEIILHLYEDYGPGCLKHLNGQFAIAIWDNNKKQLFLARDRVGIHPIFYTIAHGAFMFGSEIKALLADERVRAEIDPGVLDQIFTYWSPLEERTVFKSIYELLPAHYLLAADGQVRVERYWDMVFPDETAFRRVNVRQNLSEYIEKFRELLIDATQIRLRADVPVGAYLSGGLDSSTTSAIIRKYTNTHLDTFSIAFSDPEFDESHYQLHMADELGTEHHVVKASHEEIGNIFPEVIWHTETPILRTSPAPLFLLSKLVRQYGYKVVLTGEGADEFLAGYNIFKEALIRRFWAREPASEIRPLLLRKLYPYIGDLQKSNDSYLRAFFGDGLSGTDSPYYSHSIRWNNTSRTKRFFRDDLIPYPKASSEPSFELPLDFKRWHPLSQAQYLEIRIFLAKYLLSSQGDRMAMANSVEGRFPFLDHRVIEFCNLLPNELKLNGLTEKYLLKKVAAEWIPPEIWKRPKRPYRAPIHHSFIHKKTPDYVNELLSFESIRGSGYFKPAAVTQLVEKVRRGSRLGETDDMALVGILSTQLVHHQFVQSIRHPPAISDPDDVKICDFRSSKVGDWS
jgi:asparagine synthase (glutamine-hydrolysing)